MKILIINDSLMGGGAEKLINDIAPRMQEHGNIVDVLILTERDAKYKDNLEKEGVQVIALDEKLGHLRRISAISKHIKNGDYDIIHANLFPVIYYVALVARFRGKKMPKIVMTEHNTDNRRRHIKYLRTLERFVYKSYAKIICISSMTKEKLTEWLRFTSRDEDRLTVIDNGIPVKEYTDAQPYKRKELCSHIKEQDILLAMVGSFTEQKNHRQMLYILEKLPEKYRLILAGEGPLMDEIREKAQEMHLTKRITFLGFRSDIARILQTSDIVVIPSLWEGFGLIAVEAMACGKPVVASNVPGLAEVVGEYGLLAQPTNADDFKNQILRLEDQNLYTNYCNKSKTRAQDFDINKMVSEYEKVYEGVL